MLRRDGRKAEWDRGLTEPGRSLLIWLVCLAIKPQRHTPLTSNVLQWEVCSVRLCGHAGDLKSGPRAGIISTDLTDWVIAPAPTVPFLRDRERGINKWESIAKVPIKAPASLLQQFSFYLQTGDSQHFLPLPWQNSSPGKCHTTCKTRGKGLRS